NNCFLDHVRARRPESLEDLDDGGWDPGAEDPAIARLVATDGLAAALAQLPVSWRQAVILRHIDDMSYDEIAQVLDVPLGTAKTWLFRGRERLKELLEHQGGLS
ncbi:MAG TPA: RNA polymerase sigma factor, partial [Stenomitos sp.]